MSVVFISLARKSGCKSNKSKAVGETGPHGWWARHSGHPAAHCNKCGPHGTELWDGTGLGSKEPGKANPFPTQTPLPSLLFPAPSDPAPSGLTWNEPVGQPMPQ